MSVTSEPCKPWHLAAVERVDSTPDTRDNVLSSPGAEEILWKYARAIVDGGQVLGVIGVLPRWDSVGYAFAMLSPQAFRHGLSLTRETKRALRHSEVNLGFKRIEAAVAVGYEAGRKWIVSLGFKHEGEMKNFGPGGVGDYYLYARCR